MTTEGHLSLEGLDLEVKCEKQERPNSVCRSVVKTLFSVCLPRKVKVKNILNVALLNSGVVVAFYLWTFEKVAFQYNHHLFSLVSKQLHQSSLRSDVQIKALLTCTL